MPMILDASTLKSLRGIPHVRANLNPRRNEKTSGYITI